MSFWDTPTCYDEADSYVYAAIKPILRTETINLEDSLYRILAEEITAAKSIPPFNRATMDGYAVRAKDTVRTSPEEPKIFEIIDYVYAGSVSKKNICANECAQITTGARVPDGADAVVMTENTGVENGRLCIYKPISYGENIEFEGQDKKRGRQLLKQGTLITPSAIGLIAGQGLSKVKVYEKPKVAVISNGEELVGIDDIVKDGQIYDVNSSVIASIIKENGCLPLKFGIVGDNPQQIKAIIEEALKVADFVFVSGGTSKGDKDYLTEILQKLGKVPSLKIKGRNIKSGLLVIADGKPVLSTPGFPVSCLINAYILLVPALRKMAQIPPVCTKTFIAKMGDSVDIADSARGRFLAVKIEGSAAFPVELTNKGLVDIAGADGYIVLDSETATLQKDATVSVNLF
ncbi:MAG: gephyrin-like molybdotransferase Glp [Dehalococcoidales bacterium]